MHSAGNAGVNVRSASCDSRTTAGIARGERQAAPVVDRPARNQAGDIQHALVVLVAADAVCLNAQVRLDEVGVGANELDIEHEQQEARPRHRKAAAE